MDGNETEFLNFLDFIKNDKQVSNFFETITLFDRFNLIYDNTVHYKNFYLWKRFIDLSQKHNALNFLTEMAKLASDVYLDEDYDWLQFIYKFSNHELKFRVQIRNFEQDLNTFLEFEKAIKKAIFINQIKE